MQNSTFKKFLKINIALSILLGLFYVSVGTYLLFSPETAAAYKAIGFGIFWFVLAYITKKIYQPNLSYIKLSQVCAYIFSQAQDKTQLNENRLKQMLYLMDYECALELKKPLFPQALWSYESYLINPMAEFWAKQSQMFHKIASKGLSPSMMVPPNNLSAEEQLVLNKVITDLEDKSLFDLQSLVVNSIPIAGKFKGPWNLVDILYGKHE